VAVQEVDAVDLEILFCKVRTCGYQVFFFCKIGVFLNIIQSNFFKQKLP